VVNGASTPPGRDLNAENRQCEGIPDSALICQKQVRIGAVTPAERSGRGFSRQSLGIITTKSVGSPAAAERVVGPEYLLIFVDEKAQRAGQGAHLRDLAEIDREIAARGVNAESCAPPKERNQNDDESLHACLHFL